MTRRSKIVLVSVVSVIAVAAAIVAIRVIQFSREFNRKVVSITDEQVKLVLNSELPDGASKLRVKQFLDAKKWPHSDYGSTVQTMIRDAQHQGFIRTDIQIKFSFDSKDNLISYKINDFYTGP